ncbi:S-adenosyl-L-methionine-dependent methyltransferase [Obelidium mucronatum]|nr:S-adenosyl-L-methionine-dependent methyltransferase [Obelidium mucronatum]
MTTTTSTTTTTTGTPTKPAVPLYEQFLDNGTLPDFILRFGIRYLLGTTAKAWQQQPLNKLADDKRLYIQAIKNLPQIALNTKEANEQHYEVPTAFFQTHLGPRMKYSCAFYNHENYVSKKDGLIHKARNLAEAEIAMLELYTERAEIQDGMSILELGCGWGSLCLFLAAKYPNSPVTAISNSHGQRNHINALAAAQGIKNLTVITADMNSFQFEGKREFDRIVSIEMFEHMKNYQVLFEKVSGWLVPVTGRLFVHVFCHKSVAYDFKTEEDAGNDSWMARYFFTGGTMPSADLFLWFQDHLKVENSWIVDGRNYGQTSEDWLAGLDAHKKESIEVLTKAYGSKELGTVWFNRWRVFYMSCAELFNFNSGKEWPVVHYLFSRRS